MSQLELSINYPLLGPRELKLCGWLWGLFGVLAVAVFASVSMAVGIAANSGLELLFSLLLGAVYAYVPFNIYVKQSQACLHVNKDGLGMPSNVLGGPHWLSWSQLKAINVPADKRRLLLDFERQGAVAIESNRLNDAQMQQLLLAVEVWGSKAQWGQAALDYRDELANKTQGLETHSYTEIWEEELGRRFNSTTFIPLEPGRTLADGHYTVLKQIAFGGFSAVYLAKDPAGHELVVKESVASADEHPDAVQQKAIALFQREAELLGTMPIHEQITRVVDHFVDHGRNYLVLQYIPGENLRQYVKRAGKQPESKVLHWMLQMAQILAHLHTQQSPPIVHRDFTPDNLVLRPDGTLVLIDFGAANQFLSNATGTLVGKQCYMPPEQVRGKAEPRSDVYALGCTAYFLLTGKDPTALMECHPRQSEPSVSQSTDELIASLTKPDLSQRHLTAPDLVQRLLSMPGAISNSVPISNSAASNSLPTISTSARRDEKIH